MRNILIRAITVTLASAYCLTESTQMTGVEEGEVFSNKAEIEALGRVVNYSLHSFINCVDDNDDLAGIQFLLQSQTGKVVELEAMGDMSGNCKTLELSGEI